MVGGGGFFGSRRGFLRYDSGWAKGKYRDGLRKVSRYFVKTIAILFAKYRDTLSCSKAKRIKERLGTDQRKSGVRPFLAGGRGRFLRRVVESWRGICYNMRRSVGEEIMKKVAIVVMVAVCALGAEGTENAWAQWHLDWRQGVRGRPRSYEEVVKSCRVAAEGGDAEAQFCLALWYAKGEGVKQSYEEAVKWWWKAAQGGHVKAQCRLGECYEKGRGVEQSDLKALEWYWKAARQGDEYAKKAIKRLEKKRAEGKGQE